MSPRLATRLAAPVAALGLLLLAGAVGAAWYVHRLQRNTSDLLALNVASVRAAQGLEITLREVRFRLDGVLITNDVRRLESLPELRHEADEWLDEVDRTATTDQERAEVARIRRGYVHFFGELDRAGRESPPWRLPERMHDLMDSLLNREVLAPAHEYLSLNEAALEQASTDNRRLADWLVWGLVLLGTCGAGAGLTAGAASAWVVRRSIVQITVGLRDAAGPLHEAVGVTVEDPADPEDVDAALRGLAGPVAELVRRLQQSQREALRAEQLAMVGQMAAGVAHEVRNPLMAIKLLVQTAADRPGGGITGRGLRVLEEEVGRLERLTRTLLEFARPPRPEKHPVRVAGAIVHVLELLRARADLGGIRLVVQVPDGPAFVEADSGQLHQLLFNLVQNAIEASPDGGTVTVAIGADGDGRLVVHVSDDGPGLPSGLGSRIFEPFVSTKETGVGLGLSVCRRIADEHGWGLSAADRTTGGAEFTLTLGKLPCLPVEEGGGHAEIAAGG